MALGGVICNLLSSVRKLLPSVSEFAQAPSSSSSPPVEGHQIEAELKALMRMLERIKATLYDAEGKVIMDHSVKLWLKELKQVAYDAEDVLDDYNYEVLHAQVKARYASEPDSCKKKLVQMPDGVFNQIKHIKDKFDEIEKYRIALRLSDDDGLRRFNSELQIAPTSHFVVESDIFGREMEKEELINMLSSDNHDENPVCVVTIVGTGGLGKTTLAQLVYNDQRIKQRFDLCGWICISEDFNVERLTREAIELVTRSTCGLSNLSALQEKLSEEIRGQRVILVLDDVWNENSSHWESFRGPLMSAKEVKILVTTRNESVALIMQTIPTFKLGYMPKEQSWRLFEHYAFGDMNQNEALKLVEIGKKILEKCGKLPLAIKSIASLLWHETEEENWIDILESEIWNSDKLCIDIFTPLQLSYARLPTYLKPCFLYCSLFPKDYIFSVKKLVPLWISQGYVEHNGKKSAKKIGQEYAKQLWQRSFFEGNCEETKFQMAKFKLHDMVHDLGRLNCGNECCSIKAGEVSEFPEKIYHLYIDDDAHLIDTLPSVKFTDLRTLVIYPQFGTKALCDFDFSEANKLRGLKLDGGCFEGRNCKSFPFGGDLKHLRYLSLTDWPLPESLFSLYFLKNLTLKSCGIKELPERIGNLVSLEELTIDRCSSLKELPAEIGSLINIRTLTLSRCDIEELPVSIGNIVSLEELKIDRCLSLQELPTEIENLTNLQTLKVCHTGVNSLPPSLNKIISNIQTFQVRIECKEIGWLKDFVNLKGILAIERLSSISSVADVQCANLVSMHNLECLMLFWEYLENEFEDLESWEEIVYTRSNQLNLCLTDTWMKSLLFKDHSLLMAGLQPHPNLRELHISRYPGTAFPEWIGNPNSCASLERIIIYYCGNLVSLSLGNLCKLKYLEIKRCDGLQFLGADSLPLHLQKLEIVECSELISLPGIKNLRSLVKLSISSCEKLHSFMMDAESCVGTTLPINESLHQRSLLGLRNLISLRSLKIRSCSVLEAIVDEPRPVESCEVKIEYCPGLRYWCSHHNISYKDFWDRVYAQYLLAQPLLTR